MEEPTATHLTRSERTIIEELRTLKPYERLEIVADKDGRPGSYLTTRTVKAILIAGGLTYVK